MSLSGVESLEAAGRLLYASPLSPDELDLVEMPDGRVMRAIRPAVPQSWDFKQQKFVEHSDKPVVCAALLARMAVMRGLAHPAHHPELGRMEQGHGWIYEEQDGEPTGLPHLVATAEIHDAVQRKGSQIRAWVYDLGDPIAPFRRLPSQIHQYRSETPVEFQDVFEITGEDWPAGIATMPHYDQYRSIEEWRRALAEQIGSLSSNQEWSDRFWC